MKTIIVFCAFTLTLAIWGCRQDRSSPVSSLTNHGVATTIDVPDPALVPYTNIPYPFPNTLYRIVGAALADGPVPILECVIAEGFHLQRAWYPQVFECTAPFLDELIIELEEPDNAIYELGFVSDFSGTIWSCASHWNEYDFVTHNRKHPQNTRMQLSAP